MNRRQFLATTIASGAALAVRAADPAPKLRVAVIGHSGHGDYGHGLDVVWLRMPEVEIVGVADADAAGLAKAQKKLKLASMMWQPMSPSAPEPNCHQPRQFHG